MRRLALACALALAAPLAGLADDGGVGKSGASTSPRASDSPAPPAQGAQSPGEPLPLTLSPGETLVLGAPLTLSVELDTAPGEEVSVPEQSLEPFELVARRASAQERPGGGTHHRFEIDVIALEPGDLTLPKLDVRFVSPKGELKTRSTEPRAVRVNSPLANEPSAEPKPLAEPVSVMEDDYTLAYVAFGLLATALVAAATLLIARALKNRQKPEPPPPPPTPAWELALAQLSALSARRDAMLAEGRGAEFVEAVGNVARAYLGDRYGFDGLERTTDELLHELSALRPSELRLTDVALLLEQCDLVKFARAQPDAPLLGELFASAEKLVRGTMPGGVR